MDTLAHGHVVREWKDWTLSQDKPRVGPPSRGQGEGGQGWGRRSREDPGPTLICSGKLRPVIHSLALLFIHSFFLLFNICSDPKMAWLACGSWAKRVLQAHP